MIFLASLAYVRFLLYLRTSACFAFPRSYVRTMQPILQFARKYFTNRFTPCHPLSNTSLSSELERVLNTV